MNEHPVTIYPGRSSPVKSKSVINNKLFDTSEDVMKNFIKFNVQDGESSESEEEDDELHDQQILSDDIILGNIQSNEIKLLQQSVSLTNFDHCRDKQQSDEDFSDDSLENANHNDEHVKSEVDLTPPPPPLDNEFAVKPGKCGLSGIAWEIKLNEDNKSDKLLKVSDSLTQ